MRLSGWVMTLRFAVAMGLFVAALAFAGSTTASAQTVEDIEVRGRLVADQEALPNIYRCRSDIDAEIVPHGCLADSPAPDSSPFAAISAGDNYSCGTREDGTLECWGHDRFGETDEPQGRFNDGSTGSGLTCGIRTDRTIECWGWTTRFPNPPDFVSWVEVLEPRVCGPTLTLH